MTIALLLWLEAFRLFGAGFSYFAHAALTALGALSPLEASSALAPLGPLLGGALAGVALPSPSSWPGAPPRLRGPFGEAKGGVNSRAWKSWKP